LTAPFSFNYAEALRPDRERSLAAAIYVKARRSRGRALRLEPLLTNNKRNTAAEPITETGQRLYFVRAAVQLFPNILAVNHYQAAVYNAK